MEKSLKLISKSLFFIFLVAIIPIFIFAQVPAETPPSGGATGEAKANTLNFDGDVIEGERKRPDMFLELKSDELNIEASIYSRSDFNDFFETEKDIIPRYNK